MLFKTGWMMWNWLVSVLAVGAAIVLYDGSPLVPHPGVLWDVVDTVGSVHVTRKLDFMCKYILPVKLKIYMGWC